MFKDRLYETTNVTGTGTATLLGNVTGYFRFDDADHGFAIGDPVAYVIAHRTLHEVEIGIGEIGADHTLIRGGLLTTTNDDELVEFSVGTKEVRCCLPAQFIALLADLELTAIAGLTSAANKGIHFTGAGTAATHDLTSVARTLLAQTTQPLMRTAGLGMSDDGSALVAAADNAAIRSLLSLGTVALLTADTDGTLSANSDSRVATQKAVKTAIAAAVTGLLDFKGNLDCSANPNYPAAAKSDAYVVSVAGKVGGASGRTVDVGDFVVAKADNAGGTEASVGTSWFVLEHNLAGALLAANNLSDVTSASTARTNLGLGTVSTLASDTDGTLAANSDSRVATQKATKTYADRLSGWSPYTFGAVGDGSTDDTTAINAAISAANSSTTRKSVDLQGGTFLVSPLTMYSGVSIIGHGVSTLKLAGSSAGKVLTVTDLTDWVIDGVIFNGQASNSFTLSSSVGNRYGIYGITPDRAFIRNCTFKNFTADGIFLHTLNTANHSNTVQIANCRAVSCYRGLYLSQRAEYVQLTAFDATGCFCGLQCDAGNLVAAACNCSSNLIGIWINHDSNDGHGTISATTSNHNTINLYCKDLLYGMNFHGCKFFEGDIYLDTCKALMFVGCQIGGPGKVCMNGGDVGCWVNTTIDGTVTWMPSTAYTVSTATAGTLGAGTRSLYLVRGLVDEMGSAALEKRNFSYIGYGTTTEAWDAATVVVDISDNASEAILCGVPSSQSAMYDATVKGVKNPYLRNLKVLATVIMAGSSVNVSCVETGLEVRDTDGTTVLERVVKRELIFVDHPQRIDLSAVLTIPKGGYLVVTQKLATGNAGTLDRANSVLTVRSLD